MEVRPRRQGALVLDVMQKRGTKGLGASMGIGLGSPPDTLEEKGDHHCILQRKTLGLRKVK